MRKKKIISLMIVSLVLSNIGNYTSVLANDSKENQQNLVSITGEGVNLRTKENFISPYGFIAYMYSDDKFTDLEYIKYNIDINRLNNSNNINSAIFIAYIKPSESKTYKFSTSNNENCVLKINDKILINKDKNESIELEKDKLYKIELQVSGGLSDFELFLVDSNLEKESIKNENILLPNPSDESIPMVISNSLFINDSNTIKDSDKDGIPDDWELNGYTVKNNEILKWTSDLASEGYTKYISNPYKTRTSNDPYTDMQKVIGQIPSATRIEARDPMIPAFPKISVGMENLIMSKNQNVAEGEAGSKTVSTTKTNSTTHGVNIGLEGGLANKLFSFKVSPSYSYTNTTSTAVQDSSTDSWSSQIGINTSQAAYLNANIRYYNTGTAPIYEVYPTTNLILKNSGKSIVTIKAGPNQIGNSISPNESYPKKGLAPISLKTANSIGTVNIAISAEVLDALQKGDEVINLETTQFNGQYGIINSNGNFSTDATKKWAPIITEIEQNSANIIMKSPTSISERYIATPNTEDKNDSTPVLTIREALIKAYNLKEINGRLYYKDEESGNNYLISSKSVEIICDESTQKIIEENLKDTSKDILDLTLERGMNLTIILPDFYDDFTNKDLWSNLSTQTDSIGGVIPSNHTAKYKGKIKIEPNTDYIFKLYMKEKEHSGLVTVYVMDNNTGKTIANKIVPYMNLNQENLFYFNFNSYDCSTDNASIFIENGLGSLLVNDLSLTNLRENTRTKPLPPDVIQGERNIVPMTNSKFSVTVDIGSKNPSNIVLFADINQPQQRWIFEYDVDKEAYIIRSKLDNNKVLAWDSKNGSNVVIQDYNKDSKEQYWIKELGTMGSYYLKNYKDTNKVLGFNGYNSLENLNIEVQERSESDNQLWKIK
ncbi:binary toxin-like calcium binding domain-containing protein [Clostridium perfringens]|uniref:binary toxin-like calcium binding domain-containing protein n=1 Tax=Clostridium perfringens TaxID=1502 RepID=UPI003CEF1722